MFDLDNINTLVDSISEQHPYVTVIASKGDHEKALSLLSELLDDYDRYRLIIEAMVEVIYRYEENAPELAEFNRLVSKNEIAIGAEVSLVSMPQVCSEGVSVGDKFVVIGVDNGCMYVSGAGIEFGASVRRFMVVKNAKKV